MNQSVHFKRGQLILACVLVTPIILTAVDDLFYSRFLKIAELKDYSTDEKRDIFSTFDTENKKDKVFPVDPFDLMNRLKQAGAMDNATTPSDALDEAINAFDYSEYENVPFK